MKKLFIICVVFICVIFLNACDRLIEVELSDEEKKLLIQEVEFFESISSFSANIKVRDLEVDDLKYDLNVNANHYYSLSENERFFYLELLYDYSQQINNVENIYDIAVYDEGTFSYQKNNVKNIEGSQTYQNDSKIRYNSELNNYLIRYNEFNLSEWLNDVNYSEMKVLNNNDIIEIQTMINNTKILELLSYFNFEMFNNIFQEEFDLTMILIIDNNNHLSEIKISKYDYSLETCHILELDLNLNFNADKPNIPSSSELLTYVPYQQATFTVDFDANGGLIDNNQILVNQYGYIESFPSISNEGYQFDGWYTDTGELVNETTVISSDMTLYASWEGVYEYKLMNNDEEYFVYKYLGQDSHIVIPNWRYKGLLVTGVMMFTSDYPVEDITLSEGFQIIDDYTFTCSNLKKLKIPNSVNYISKYALIESTGLDTIEVDSQNQSYSSSDGVLFNKDKTILIKYPSLNTNLTYTIPSSVTTINEQAFLGTKFLKNLTILENVEIIGHAAFLASEIETIDLSNVKKLTEISEDCFADNINLKSIFIPANIEKINKNAFKGALLEQLIFEPNSKLKYIGSEAFANTKLESFEILSNVTHIGQYAFKKSLINTITFENTKITEIGDYAFAYLAELRNIEIPSQVERIGYGAFLDSKNLLSITLPFVGRDPNAFGNASLFGYVFGGTQNELVPKTLETIIITRPFPIKDNAFSGLSSVRTIELDEGITELGKGIFSNMNNLTTVNLSLNNTHLGFLFGTNDYMNQDVFIPASLKNVNLYGNNISEYAFYGLKSIENITLADTITSIGSYAFAGMEKITKLIIPNSVDTIDAYAVYNSYNLLIYLMNATKPDGWSEDWYAGDISVFWDVSTTADNGVFHYSISNEYKVTITKYIGNEANVIIPSFIDGFEVVEIAQKAFFENTIIKNVGVPASVKVIGSRAFYDSSLEAITFEPNSLLTTIDTEAFALTNDLLKIIMPSNLKNLNYAAFYSSGVREIVFPENCLLTVFENGVFSNTHNLEKIIIPGSIEEIKGYAFINSGINEILFSSDSVLKTIGLYAFASNINLKSITIPSTVETIGYDAFANSGLIEVYIPFEGALELIEFGAFRGLNSLKTITLPFVGGDPVNNHFGYIFGAPQYHNQNNYILSTLLDVYVAGSVISENSFYGITQIKNIFISSSITTIEAHAFEDCGIDLFNIEEDSKLTRIGYRAFYNATHLKDLILPNKLEFIDNEAFVNTKGLNSIVFPSSLNTIGYRAFYDSGIENISFEDNSLLEIIGPQAFKNLKQTTLIIPDSVKIIGSSAFDNCTDLITITLPFIGHTTDTTHFSYLGYIFGALNSANQNEYLPNLETLIITNTTEIGEFALSNLYTIKTIVLPESLTTISQFAFWETSNLETITIPASVTSIGDSAFINSGLKSIGFSANSRLNNIGANAFANTLIESIIIPQSVETIGFGAFANTILTNITLPFMGGSRSDNHVFAYIFGAEHGEFSDMVPQTLNTIVINEIDEIIDYAFYNLIFATDIVLPDSYTKIGDYAFYNCGITSFNIPKDVVSIGKYAFAGSKITTLNIEEASKLNTIDDYAFSEIDLSSLMIPKMVTDLGSYVFYDSSIEVLTFEEGITLTDILDYGLYGMKFLKTLTLPDSLESIGEYAIGEAVSLTNLVIGNNVTTIGKGALINANSLNTLTIPFIGGSTLIGETNQHLGYIFDNLDYRVQDNYVPETLQTVNITNTTHIGDHAFIYLHNIKEINLPENLISFGHATFLGTYSLTKIRIPASVIEISTRCFVNSGIQEVIFEDNSNLLIIAADAFAQTYSLNDITIPSTVTIIENSAFSRSYLKEFTFADGSEIETIADNAFSHTYMLNRIVIPSTVKSIERYAFYNSGINELIFSDQSQIQSIDIFAFSKTNIVNITIPETINFIGEGVFSECSNITSLTVPFIGPSREESTIIGYLFGGESYFNQQNYLPTSLKKVVILDAVSIADYAFYNLTNIETVELGSSITLIGQYAFYNTSSLNKIIIPSNVLEIGDYAFTNSSIQEISFSENSILETIGKYAFSNTLIETITLPASLRTVDEYSFNKTLLTAIIFEEDSFLDFIGDYAFNDSHYLVEINIPDSVSFIGKGILTKSYSLKTLQTPFIGQNMDSLAVLGYLFSAGNYYDPNILVPGALETVILTKTDEIPDRCFYGLENIKTIVLPNNVIRIGKYALYNMKSLTSINIPESVKTIDESAFYNVESLTNLIIPSSVTEIGDRAFGAMKELTNIEIPNSVTKIGFGAFVHTNLNSISLPFIGQSLDSNSYLGYVFGAHNGHNQNTSVPSSLATVTINGGNIINDYAFYGLVNIKELNLNQLLTSISINAFHNTQLEVININNENSLYKSIDSVIYNNDQTHLFHYPGGKTEEDFTIPSTVVSIGKNAFSNSKIKFLSLDNDNSIESIEFGAFENTNFISMTLPFVGGSINTNKFIGYIFGSSSNHDQNYYVPTSLQTIRILGGDSIDAYAFSVLSNITEIYLPTTITSIGYGAFMGTTNLTNIFIPKNVETIDDFAFGSSGITEFIVEEDSNLISLGASVLVNTFNLTKVSLPFVGANMSATGNSATFGYLFGSTSYGLQQSRVPSTLETVIITGGNKIENWAFYNLSSIKHMTLPASLTTIGNQVFSGTSICEITIPASVSSLGSYTFTNHIEVIIFEEGSQLTEISMNCFRDLTNLREVVLPQGLLTIGIAAFQGATSLLEITIPETVTSIASGAFMNCNFTEIVIPSSVVSIGDYAFKGCNNLLQITLPFVGNTPTSTNHRALFGYIFGLPLHSDQNLVVPESLETVIITNATTIKNNAFSGLQNIKYLMLPNTLTNLGSFMLYNSGVEVVTFEEGSIIEQIDNAAFYGATFLTTINIPESVKYLNQNSFTNTYSLNSIDIPSSVKRIEYGVFEGSGLTSVTIPNGVEYIGRYAFARTDSLTSITLPFVGLSLNEEEYSFFGAIFGSSYYYDQADFIPLLLEEVIITGGTSIADNAFIGITTVKRITLPDSLTTIGRYSFGYTGIEEVNFGENSDLTTIGEHAFSHAYNLKTIIIPLSVDIIDSWAFLGNHEDFIIYVRASVLPLLWDPYWNGNDKPVVWGYSG